MVRKSEGPRHRFKNRYIKVFENEHPGFLNQSSMTYKDFLCEGLKKDEKKCTREDLENATLKNI
jgi:hypothetical protein